MFDSSEVGPTCKHDNKGVGGTWVPLPKTPLIWNKCSITDVDASLVKAFRNLVSGEDDELSTGYAHFHKMVDQEQGAVRNATLAAMGQLQKDSTTV